MKNSALKKWEYREHTRVKHILLGKYLAAWIPILGKYNPRICYCDSFAGRGEYIDEKTGNVIQTGSPLIALNIADRLSGYFGKLICFFIEKDRDNFTNLEEVLEREKSNIKNWEKIEVIKENNEFANIADEIFKYLEGEGGSLVPSFFFLDPFGFSGIPFSVITRILSNPKTEVFFTFMARDIARFIKLPKLEDTFNSLFGSDEWKGILALPQKREIDLINLYRKRLHEVANVKYSWAFRVCASEKVETLYYLIHATNNFKGHSIMKSIMFKQSAKGDFAYLGPQDIAMQSQMRLFDIHIIEDLKKFLLQRFKGETIAYDKIQEEVCIPWYSEPPYIDKHYRQALELESERKIRIERVTSRTPRGLSRDDQITFPQSNPVAIDFSSFIPKLAIKPKNYYKEYQQLDGNKETLVSKVGDGSIITRFDKTPPPTKQTNVVCPHFLELKWAYGCPFDCAWCYLKGTFRFRPSGMKPVIKDYEKIELHTRRFLSEVTAPEILNTGEIADSLMWEASSKPFSKFIIPLFEQQDRHKVLFVTKSDNIKNLLEINPHNQVIVSFSFNADEVARRWEKGAPSVDRRIEAGRKLSQAGYEVRIRIDPIVPVANWRTHYTNLIDQIFTSFVPARTTLGSLRGLQSTINGCNDTSWLNYLKENSNWGKKVEFNTRYEMYATLISQLKEKYNYKEVALCKETLAMWAKLGMDYKNIKCNCVW